MLGTILTIYHTFSHFIVTETLCYCGNIPYVSTIRDLSSLCRQMGKIKFKEWKNALQSHDLQCCKQCMGFQSDGYQPCAPVLYISVQFRWRKESREVFVEQTLHVFKKGPCRNHVHYIQIFLKGEFAGGSKWELLIHPQSSQAQSLQFSMKKKKKVQKRKRLAMGYISKPFGQ